MSMEISTTKKLFQRWCKFNVLKPKEHDVKLQFCESYFLLVSLVCNINHNLSKYKISGML